MTALTITYCIIQKYSVLKITELYHFELGKFMYLYRVKAFEPDILTSHNLFFTTSSSS